MKNTSIEIIWLKFKAYLYPIIHVCLSISAQLCCKIEIISLWVHLNGIPTCVIFANLSWPSMIQYSTNNHASSYIVVTSNFPNPDCIGPVKYSGSYIILSFLPSEWTWHCVYLIWPCPFFSMIFSKKFLWGSNDLSRLIIDRVNKKLLSDSIPFLCGIYSLLSASLWIPGCVWLILSYVMW